MKSEVKTKTVQTVDRRIQTMPIVEIKETTQTISKPQQTTVVDTVKIPQTSKLVSRFGNNMVLN
jgi:hypothetical protein